ncbi:MAG: hypothetical protein ACI4HM_08595 [Ruminococcus sp.]
MSDYVFLIGDDDFSKENREYISLDTSEGQKITVALTASSVPFCGRFNDSKITFAYDSDYKDTVDEIISKITSEEYADIRREIKEHKGEDCLYFIPTVAKLLRMTEGTLRSRPSDIQLAVCKHYTDIWCCDTYTIQRELENVLTLKTQE